MNAARASRPAAFAVVLAAIASVGAVMLSGGRSGGGDPLEVLYSPSVAGSPAGSLPGSKLLVVGLGDSVTAGSRCRCRPFVGGVGDRLAQSFGVTVATSNFGAGGQTSASLARMVGTRASVRSAITKAAFVIITIGANDFDFNDYTGTPCDDLSCYTPALDALRANMRELLNAITSLRAGKPTAIRVTGYWAIWEDGEVGRRNGKTYMRIGDALTRRVNEIISDAATAAHDRYIDLYAPFRGSDGSRDDTGLLAADGDHPNAAGHDLISTTILAAGTAELKP